eukprot:2289209-Karenia_brevis.AAC.1
MDWEPEGSYEENLKILDDENLTDPHDISVSGVTTVVELVNLGNLQRRRAQGCDRKPESLERYISR